MANNKKIIKSASIYNNTESYMNMFKDYENLEEVDLTNVKNKEDVMFTTNMFNNCQNIKSINMSNWNTENIVECTNMFKDIPENIEWGYDYDNYGDFTLTEEETDYSGRFPWNIVRVVKYTFSSNSNIIPTFNSEFTNYTTRDTDNGNGTITREIFAEKRDLPYSISFKNTSVIEINQLNTKNLTSMENMFYNCSSLKKIESTNWNTSKVTDMSSMFFNCVSLESLDVSNWDTSKVTDMGYVFFNCNNLESLDVSNWDTSKVNTMYGLFNNCKKLSFLDVSNWIVTSVTNMGYMFNECSSLISLELDRWNITNVTNMEYMFSNCTSLTTLDLNNFNTSSVTNSSYALNNVSSSVNWNYADDKNSYKDFSLHEEITNFNGQFPWNSYIEYTILSSYNADDIVTSYTDANYYRYLPRLYYGSNYNEYVMPNANQIVLTLNDDTITTAVSTTKVSDIKKVKLNFRRNYIIRLAFVSGNSNAATTNYIKSVLRVANSNLKSLGGMFTSCNLLESVDFTGWDTSNVIDMGSMFRGCASLKTLININEINTSKVTSLMELFYGCNGLQEIDLSKWDVRKVTHISRIFASCVALKKINLSGWNTSKLNWMESAFSTDSNVLEEVDLSNFDTRNVIVDSENHTTYAFTDSNTYGALNFHYNGSNYKNWTLNESESSYASIFPWTPDSEIFHIEYRIKSRNKTDTILQESSTHSQNYILYPLYLPEFKFVVPSHVSGFVPNNLCDIVTLTLTDGTTTKDLSTLACNVDKIRIDVPTCLASFNFVCYNQYSHSYIKEFLYLDPKFKFKKLDDVFYACQELETIHGIENWDVSQVKDMNEAFLLCNKLTSLDLSGWDTSNVTNMSYMFDRCTSLENLNLSTWDTSLVTNEKKMFDQVPISINWNYDGTNYANFTLTETDTNYSGKFPWTKITVAKYTFTSTTDTLPTFNTEFTDYTITDSTSNGVTTRTIKAAEGPTSISFQGKTALLSVEELDTSNVTSMRNIFCNCYGLTSLDLSNCDTSKVTRMDKMFSDCNKLTSLDLSNFNTNNVTNMANMFYNCIKLTSLDLSNFNTNNVTNMYFMFYGCSALTSLDVSNFNTSNVTKMEGMFYNCSSLTSLDLSNFNTSKVTNMEEMFYNCSKLTSLDLSNFDTRSIKYSSYMLYKVPASVNWNYTGLTTYVNFTLTEADTGYNTGAMFPWSSDPNHGHSGGSGA